MRSEAEEQVTQLASRQHGVATREQLEAIGVGHSAFERHLRTGAWRWLQRGVVCVAPAGLGADALDLAALLAAGEGAALSHFTAARRLGLDLPRFKRVHLTVPVPRKPRPLAGARVWRSRDLLPDDVAQRGLFRITRLGRTVLDLAALLDDGWLRAMVDSALRRSPSNREWMALALEQHGPGRRGAERLRRLLGARTPADSPTESPLESLAMELGLATGRKPRPQFVITDGRAFRARVDLAWPEVSLCVELDGYGSHCTRLAFQRDRARDRGLQALGWSVLRFTWDDVDANRQRTIDELARAYTQALGRAKA